MFTITAITMRRHPIYLSTYTGRPPDEPSVLGEALNEIFIPLLKKVFPEYSILPLPQNHEIFHTFFDIDQIIQTPNEGNGCYGGQTWEQADDKEPRVYGISDSGGRLMVAITYNTDLGDAWEWADDPEYPALFTTYAYRLGMNSIIYAMTH